MKGLFLSSKTNNSCFNLDLGFHKRKLHEVGVCEVLD